MKCLLALSLLLAASSNLLAGTGEKNPKAPVLPPPPPPAPACGISYDYIDAGWNHIFPDEGGDADGYFVGLNKTIHGNLFGFAGGGQTFSGDFDSLDAAAGVGYHVPLFRCFDWVTKVGCLYQNADGYSDWGYTAGTGFRISVTSWLELDTFYHFSNVYADLEEERDHSATASLVFKQLGIPQMDTVVSGVYTDSGTSVSVGLRYNF